MYHEGISHACVCGLIIYFRALLQLKMAPMGIKAFQCHSDRNVVIISTIT